MGAHFDHLRYWNLQPFQLFSGHGLQQYLSITVLKLRLHTRISEATSVATVPTVYGMRRRGRGSRGAKRRWGPHISSPWLKGRENKVYKVTVPTVYGMRRRVRGSRGAKRRWGPHISSPWPEERENRGDKATVLTACGIETNYFSTFIDVIIFKLQQCLPFTVCDEGCETAEERSDDEVRTSLVPDCKEGKTKVIR